MSGFTEDAIALPGHVLQPKNLAPDFVAGKGTYLSDNGELRSSIVGKVKIDDNVVSVVAHASSSSSAQDRSIDVSDRVHGRVVKVMTNQVIVEVLAVNNIELRTASKGVIRREDVRTTETDQILMQDCFRPGDIVIAAVTSLGDQRQMYLSTADSSLGVRFANSKSSNTALIAISSSKMKDPVTGVEETRKVALEPLEQGKLE
jgi:exosome complex component CSL4